MKLLTDEWVKIYLESLNQDEDFKRMTRSWENKFLFVFQGGDQTQGLLLDIWRGTCKSADVVSNKQQISLCLAGPMASWDLILKKESNFFKLVIEQQMELRGDIDTLMKNLPAIKLMTRKMAEVTPVS